MTADSPQQASAMALVGYASHLSVRPGDSIAFMVSCAEPFFDAEVVRLRHGDERPSGPGRRSEVVPSDAAGRHPGRVQHVRPGSYVRVDDAPSLALEHGFDISLWVWPTLLEAGTQTLVAKRDRDNEGAAVQIEADGRVVLRLAGARGGAELSSEVRLVERRWQRVEASFDSTRRAVELRVDGTRASGSADVGSIACSAPLTFGAVLTASADGDLAPSACFNGKLEGVELARSGAMVAQWDFSRDMSSRRVVDVSGSELHGTTVNRPTRAVTGRKWDRREIDPRHAPEQWAAIYFHDDDLDDAGWEVDLSWKLPEEIRSGVYALHATAGEHEDHIPFFVCPPRGTAAGRIALVLPTFSYLAYANTHMLSDPAALEVLRAMGMDLDYPTRASERYIVANRLNSLYDKHPDGSGVCYSSMRRPIVNMRPEAREPHLAGGAGAPHQLSADLHLIDWLEHEGFSYDLLTDEQLHSEGVEVLAPYDVVLSGTHPEYVSGAILDALQGFVDRGGRLMYLGGNGYYWVTALDPHERHTIEVRRWGPATRLWDAGPGNWHVSFTGELGGLWRFRDRAPQQLFGVGFTANGIGRGHPYERTDASQAPELSFIFEGLDPDELIGDEPALVNGWGAAGFELDRFDHELGTPASTVLLATARGFSSEYQAVVDDMLVADSQQSGDISPLARADMTIYENAAGGAVFSVGSIQWCSCLSARDYQNSVARVTGNVLRRLLVRERLGLPGAG